jgi:hypothetical protein
MKESPSLRDQIVAKYREQDPGLDPDVVGRIVDDVSTALGTGSRAGRGAAADPFAVAWMDSYLAHWVLGQQVQPEGNRLADLAPVIRDLMDSRFAERVEAIREWIDRVAEPPDGGPPEPGVPPVGPSAVFSPPDGGTPEPGVPPVGPSPEPPGPVPPDGGPPEPGVPPVGPDAILLGENPWILYWFVSLKMPLLVDMIDAHLERRLSELGIGRT